MKMNIGNYDEKNVDNYMITTEEFWDKIQEQNNLAKEHAMDNIEYKESHKIIDEGEIKPCLYVHDTSPIPVCPSDEACTFTQQFLNDEILVEDPLLESRYYLEKGKSLYELKQKQLECEKLFRAIVNIKSDENIYFTNITDENIINSLRNHFVDEIYLFKEMYKKVLKEIKEV